MSAEDRFPSYRAPQENHQVLCVPPWPAIGSEISSQRDLDKSNSAEIAGLPLRLFAQAAREALLEQAVHYTNSYTDAAKVAAGPIIVTGHQPELVHPGVWLKNFATAQLAREVSGTAISLVIDNDLCRQASVRVPTGTLDEPRSVDIPFDQPQAEIPYEERKIVDRETWSTFGQRATSEISSLIKKPILKEWWPEVLTLSQQTSQLGLAISQARHRLEQSWGCQILEVPQSLICQTPPFLRFACDLLFRATQLKTDYNTSLKEYRQAHRLRSPAQPLPDLQVMEGWTEVPFWIWTTENPTRRALFVKPSDSGLLLSDRHGWQDILPTRADESSDLPWQRLTEWQTAGLKLRSRALITTMYARLLLADTFVHGIGGAKYDQVTNLLCERFFGVSLPNYVTLSGTLRLPLQHTTVSPSRVSELRQKLRRLRFHPEKQFQNLKLNDQDISEITAWVAQKNAWVQTSQTAENAAHRHMKIETANLALQAWLKPEKRLLETELSAAIAQIRKNRLLESREYPFCLFPQNELQDFLLDFSGQMA